jgi:galactose-1-phosphate uridylyltransferase
MLAGGFKMAIEFKKKEFQSSFYDPMNDFSERSSSFEIRVDPLTGETSRVVPETGIEFQGREDLSDLIKESEGCFFCSENVERLTPKFKEDLSERGRIEVGDAVLFPNLFPYGKYSAVCTFSGKHFIPVGKFTPKLMKDALIACRVYAEKVHTIDEEAKYCTVNWNYLSPAGSSLMHPHLQPLIEVCPTSHHKTMMECSRRYYDENGSIYWEDLLNKEEELNNRYIGRTGSVRWITPFSPKGHYEVRGITASYDYISLSDEEINDLAEGIIKVLQFYDSEERNSFNLSIYSGELGGEEHFLTNVRLIARSNMQKYYMNDASYLKMLLDETVVSTSPEEISLRIKKFF